MYVYMYMCAQDPNPAWHGNCWCGTENDIANAVARDDAYCQDPECVNTNGNRPCGGRDGPVAVYRTDPSKYTCCMYNFHANVNGSMHDRDSAWLIYTIGFSNWQRTIGDVNPWNCWFIHVRTHASHSAMHQAFMLARTHPYPVLPSVDG